MPKTLIPLVVCVLAFLFVLRVVHASYRGAREDFERWPSQYISGHPELTGIAGLREISFEGMHGDRIAAWYAPGPSHAAVVLVHGTQADRSSMLAETRFLVAAGYAVLALDLPGQGASQGNSLWGEGERRAVSAAVDWLSTQADVDPQRIGGLGVSFGGYILTQAAALDTRLRAIALISTPSDIVTEARNCNARWGWLSEAPALWVLRHSGMPYTELQPIDVIHGIAPRAVLIIGGEKDPWVPPGMSRALYDAAGQPKTIWLVPGGRHAGYADADTATAGTYRKFLLDFYGQQLQVRSAAPSLVN